MKLKEFTTPRRVAVAITGVMGLWLVVAVAATGVYRASAPAVALKLAPNDARAKENLADAMLRLDSSARGVAQAAVLAKEALKRDATSAVALRILGFAATRAKQPVIFNAVARLSRRDLPTQLWLIEKAVEADDVPAALAHHDIALRTSALAQPLLFPVLSEATGERRLVPDITRMLARKPDWAAPFLYEAVNSSPSAANLVAIFTGLTVGGQKIDPVLARNLVSRTIRDNRFDLTLKAYRIAGGRNTDAGRVVADGSFSGIAGVEPFSWTYASDGGLYADRIATDGNNGRVVIRAEAGVSGNAIKQLLLLRPGSYQLSFAAGDVPAADRAKFLWAVTCAKSQAVIGTVEVAPQALKQARNSGTFSVPAIGCDAQWLALTVNAEMDSGSNEPWIDNVSISKLSGTQSATPNPKTEVKP